MGACQPGKVTSHVDELPLTEHVVEMAGFARMAGLWGAGPKEKKLLSDCTGMLNREFGANVHPDTVGQAFGYNPDAGLNLHSFALLVYRMRRIPQVSQLHSQYWSPHPVARPTKGAGGSKGGGPVDGASAFATFLREVQGEMDPKGVIAAIEKQAGVEGSGGEGAGGAGGDATYDAGVPRLESQLTQFLWSDMNDIMVPSKMEQYQSMDHPLSDYYIATARGAKLKSEKVAALNASAFLTSTLKRHARCVEIDCWDGANGVPEALEKMRLGKRPTFKKTLAAVAKSAFKSSDWPVFIVLDVNCCNEQQAVLVQDMEEVLGSRGLLADKSLFTAKGPLPSPAALKGKVVVLLGRSEDPEGFEDKIDEMAENVDAISARDAEGNEPEGVGIIAEYNEVLVNCAHLSLANNGAFMVSAEVRPRAEHVARVVMHELLCIEEKAQIDFNNAGLVYVSTSHKPLMAMRYGHQMVAMNYFAADNDLWSQQALFKENGNSGFVLKPPFLRLSVNPDDPAVQNQWPEMLPRLAVTVISAKELPLVEGAASNPAVRLVVESGSEVEQMAITSSVTMDTGCLHLWDECFTFKIPPESISVLKFVIKDRQDDNPNDVFCGQCSIPVSAIREGVRSVRLFDEDGKRIPGCKMLVHLQWQPDEDEEYEEEDEQ